MTTINFTLAELSDAFSQWIDEQALKDCMSILADKDLSIDGRLSQCNELLELHGVEYLKFSPENGEFRPNYDINYPDAPEFYYLNSGDTYSTTVVFDPQDNTFLLTCWGDQLEHMEKKLYRSFKADLLFCMANALKDHAVDEYNQCTANDFFRLRNNGVVIPFSAYRLACKLIDWIELQNDYLLLNQSCRCGGYSDLENFATYLVAQIVFSGDTDVLTSFDHELTLPICAYMVYLDESYKTKFFATSIGSR
jgi:hypothetical protein